MLSYLVACFIPTVLAVSSCSSDVAPLAVFLLRLSPEDVHLVAGSSKLWQFALAADRLIEKAAAVDSEDAGLLFIVDNYLPPSSFLDAVETMTSSQRMRIAQLSLQGQSYEVDRILDGLLRTLPADDQNYANTELPAADFDDTMSLKSVKNVQEEQTVPAENEDSFVVEGITGI